MIADAFNDPKMQELARRRLNDEIYKQSMLSAAKNEGRIEERENIIRTLKSMGYSDDEIAAVVKRLQDNDSSTG